MVVTHQCPRCDGDGAIEETDLGVLEPAVRCGDDLWGVACSAEGCGVLLCPDCEGAGTINPQATSDP
jgi:hypothetical protein